MWLTGQSVGQSVGRSKQRAYVRCICSCARLLFDMRACLYVPHSAVVMGSYRRHRRHCHNCVTKQIFYLLRSRDNESYLFCLWHKFSSCYALLGRMCACESCLRCLRIFIYVYKFVCVLFSFSLFLLRSFRTVY